jgi:hypothetical protein
MTANKLFALADLAFVLWLAWNRWPLSEDDARGIALIAALVWGLWAFARWLWHDGPNARGFKRLLFCLAVAWWLAS